MRLSFFNLTLFKNKYLIESARLKNWDYSSSAAYFLTICTKNMINFLSKIRNEKVFLTSIGNIVKEEWLQTEKIRDNIVLDEYAIMPNHVHGIILIFNDENLSVETHSMRLKQTNLQISKGDAFDASLRVKSKDNISNIIRGFKSRSTSRILRSGHLDFAWQPRFYDHIIRTEKGLDNIRDYILMNPAKWNRDEYYKD